MATESISVINPQTLSVKTTLDSTQNVYQRNLTKIFNFESQQVTTIFDTWLISNGAGAALTSQMTVQNFSDVQSQEEIKRMWDKLVELKGKPSPLEEATLPKKSLSQPTP